MRESPRGRASLLISYALTLGWRVQDAAKDDKIKLFRDRMI